MTDRQIMQQHYREKLKKRFCNPSDIEGEILNALAYGCTLQYPRAFGGVLMTSEDFADLIDMLDNRSLSDMAARLVVYGKRVSNRLWYILGMLARFRAKLSRHNVTLSDSCASDFIQHSYTRDELASVVTSIDELDAMDI